MTVVGVGKQRSQAVGSGSSHCPAKNFHDLSLTFFHTEISETLRGSPTKILGTVRQKIFDGKS